MYSSNIAAACTACDTVLDGKSMFKALMGWCLCLSCGVDCGRFSHLFTSCECVCVCMSYNYIKLYRLHRVDLNRQFVQHLELRHANGGKSPQDPPIGTGHDTLQ